MAAQKIVDLLKALKAGTEANRVYWEDLPDEEMFRAQLGGGLIRIGKMEDDPKGYTLWLIGHGGEIAAELNFHQGEPSYELIQDVYSAARLSARGGEQIIDDMIRQLTPG